jgi:hypothetical protein
MCHRYLSSVKLAAVALLVGAGTLRAADIDLPTIGGEQAVFADGFDDNAAGWTLTNAVIGNGDVGPTTPQNGSVRYTDRPARWRRACLFRRPRQSGRQYQWLQLARVSCNLRRRR